MRKDKIHHILEQLNQSQEDQIKVIASLENPFKQLNNSWSAVQVLEHVYLSQAGIFKYIQDKGMEKGIGKTSLTDRIKNLVLKFMLNGKNKFKAPRVLPAPLNKNSPEKLAQKFSSLNQNITDYINSLPEEKLNKVVFKHPRAGKMDILAVVKFWLQHWHHHKKQLNALHNG